MTIFFVMFGIMFCMIIGMFIFAIVDMARKKIKNDRSPRLTVPVTIVAKRTDVSSHHHHGMDDGCSHVHYSTSYYVTFQVQSGDRLELEVGSDEFGYLVEGDYGNLSFQGTRFLGFERMQ